MPSIFDVTELPPYTADPVDRLRHTLAAHDQTGIPDDAHAVTATNDWYGPNVWTGLTFADLRAILHRLT